MVMPRSTRLPLSPLGVLIAVITGLLIAVIVVGLLQGILDPTVVATGLMGLLTAGLLTSHRGSNPSGEREDGGDPR
jgi:hypothetical protein